MDYMTGKNLGRYHVIEPLGQGGMASVYKAYDTSLERNVAIKIIRTDKMEGDEEDQFLKRFRREAKALAQLDHPYILKVLDYGEQDGIPYLVMPFLDGGTLKERMGHPIPYQEAAALLAPIARALEYAHQLKIIHRDVKPANILVGRTGTPILSDFGIAKILDAGESTQLTGTGVGLGTPDYMAPEQWMGKASQLTDMYSLGVVFFQMVTGSLPFSADTPAAVLIKHMQDPLPRPSSFVPNLPEAVEQVLFKVLAKEPENRFSDMGVFADLLEKLAHGGETVVVPVSTTAETVQGTVLAASALRESGKVPKPVTAQSVKKGMPGWLIALIVIAVVVVLGIVGVLAGGAYLASRALKTNPVTTLAAGFISSQLNATLPADLMSTQVNATSVGASSVLLTEIPPTSASSASPKGTPFTTIKDFPADVPLLKDNNGDLTTTVTQGVTMYMFSTNLSFKEVIDYYLTGMNTNSWQKVSDTTQTGMEMMNFTKGDNRTVAIMIQDQSGKKVEVIIEIQ